MANYNYGIDFPYRAAVDLSDYQYHFVIAGSVAGEVTYAATLAGCVLGVLMNDPTATEEATVRVLGIAPVIADSTSAIVYGQWVKTGSTGLAIGSANQAASTFDVGIALGALDSGSGVKIPVLLTGMQAH